MKVLVTGATGFIGKSLIKKLRDKGCDLSVLVRDESRLDSVDNLDVQLVKSFNMPDLLAVDFTGIDCIIHLAARAHVLKEESENPLELYRAINTDTTIALAKLAAEAGVKRFIFLSSIGVNGVSTNKPFKFDDQPKPLDHYGLSKLEAEQGIQRVASETKLDVTIIRPPLVYGADAPGNFGKLLKVAKKNHPLPLGAINNKRSLVALDNLLDLIVTCIEHPNAANQIFLVSDAEDISTTELLTTLIRAAGNKPRLIPVPMSWLRLVGKLTGKLAVIERLSADLQVDISHTQKQLGWRPVISVADALNKCCVKDIN